MKKLSLNKLSLWKINIFAPITILLIICIFATMLAAAFINQNYQRDEIEYVSGYLETWVSDINAKGAEWFVNEAAQNPQDTVLPAGCNLVLLDKDGKILYARNDDFIQGKTKLNLMVSPYGAYREGWVYKRDNYYRSFTSEFARLALLVNDVGQVQASIRLVESNNAPNVGNTLPKYQAYFPALNHEYYQDALKYVTNEHEWSDYDWSSVGSAATTSSEQNAADEWDASTDDDDDWADWGDEAEYAKGAPMIRSSLPYENASYDEWGDLISPDVSLPTPPDQAMAVKVKEYVQWENAQMSRAGDMRMIYRGPAWDGSQLLVLYRDNDDMHSAYIRNMERNERSNTFASIAVALVGLMILSLAAWVFVDAKKRNFHPAMWAILTLIGNVIAWIVYRLVRPNGRVAKGCPHCGAPSKPTHAFCPVCGHVLCDKCASCGHILESTWRFCPSCGHDIHPAELPPPEAPKTEQSDVSTAE